MTRMEEGEIFYFSNESIFVIVLTILTAVVPTMEAVDLMAVGTEAVPLMVVVPLMVAAAGMVEVPTLTAAVVLMAAAAVRMVVAAGIVAVLTLMEAVVVLTAGKFSGSINYLNCGNDNNDIKCQEYVDNNKPN